MKLFLALSYTLSSCRGSPFTCKNNYPNVIHSFCLFRVLWSSTTCGRRPITTFNSDGPRVLRLRGSWNRYTSAMSPKSNAPSSTPTASLSVGVVHPGAPHIGTPSALHPICSGFALVAGPIGRNMVISRKSLSMVRATSPLSLLLLSSSSAHGFNWEWENFRLINRWVKMSRTLPAETNQSQVSKL